MDTSAIVINHLSVSFAGRAVIQDLSATIPEGGLTVVVGPNGAGKTTLLMCLIGELAHQGKVSFAPGLAGSLGFVPQRLNVDRQTPITVREFMALHLTRRPLWLGISKTIRESITQALGLTGIADCEDCSLGDLSGGQVRRVLLAAALSRKPKLLFLDEPAAGVDLKGQELFWDILDEQRRNLGLTVVIASHNLLLAAHYATHVLCLKDGQCLEGLPREVLTGSNFMNIFGVPIHLYPEQCDIPQHQCPTCGAFDNAGEEHGHCPMKGPQCACERGCCRG